MAMEYKCGVCGKILKQGLAEYVEHTEVHIIELIKEKNPGWVEKDGVCRKCHSYYKKQLKGEDA